MNGLLRPRSVARHHGNTGRPIPPDGVRDILTLMAGLKVAADTIEQMQRECARIRALGWGTGRYTPELVQLLHRIATAAEATARELED